MSFHIFKNKKSFLLLFFIIFTLSSKGENFSLIFEGNALPIIELTPEKSTGLDKIYVLSETNKVSVVYEFTDSPPEWFKFSNLGAAYSAEITNVNTEGRRSILTELEGDMGYLIKTQEGTYYFWIVDYKKHYFTINGIEFEQQEDCDKTTLKFNGEAGPINFYTINGRQETINRGINVSYYSLAWNDELKYYELQEYSKEYAYFNNTILINPAVYCPTTFLIKGDTFLNKWGLEVTYESSEFTPVAVAVETEVKQTGETIDNIINTTEDELGGSAPVDIDFISHSTDAVVHFEWQFSQDEEFNNIEYRFNERDLSYTFREEGTTFVRFVGSNSNGTCEAFGQIYKVNIGSSELLIPNAFSPNGDGINDEWKVSYRSLIDFKCRIFNRNGHEIFFFDDPSSGWDGKRNGKYVNPGVYYYVIEATGADGKKYKKTGDINILKTVESSKYESAE